jgi:ABC-2 type transport system permease protein
METEAILQSLASVNFVEIGTCFILYFIGGYLLYGSMFAAAGSTVDQPNEGSQATVPMMMFLVLALWVGLACMENPDGALAWWCSMIPFTSPVVMMVRLPYDVALWEITLSVIILFASALGIAILAGKIYRKGILLYGKKFSWKNIGLWLK